MIFTDSLSSIQALQGNNTNRKEITLEIRYLLHQIIIKGTQILNSWIPSHCGIKGNDLADQAAKLAAKGTSGPKHNIKLSIPEIKSILKKVLFEKWSDEFSAYCQKHNYHNKLLKQGLFLSVPYSTLSRIHRFHTNAIYCKFKADPCSCLGILNRHHLFHPCQDLRHEIQSVLQKLSETNTSFDETILFEHHTMGWQPLLWLVENIGQSSLKNYF